MNGRSALGFPPRQLVIPMYIYGSNVRRLWPPPAAISSARLAWYWDLMSANSTCCPSIGCDLSALPGRRSGQGPAGARERLGPDPAGGDQRQRCVLSRARRSLQRPEEPPWRAPHGGSLQLYMLVKAKPGEGRLARPRRHHSPPTPFTCSSAAAPRCAPRSAGGS